MPIKAESFYARERKLRARAGQVMAELQARGVDWQIAWRDHPVAKEYRELMREAWTTNERIPFSPGFDR